jgi:hypothetical protein
MYRILTASKDNYITNKIVNNSFRATDANVGQAPTLDLFKLYAESTSGSNTSPLEISRILVKFDLKPLKNLTSSFLDTSRGSFNCTLKLFDVYGGQTCPSNFTIMVAPLSKSFDEGTGLNVVDFSDLDSSNFVTSSVLSGTPVSWEITGANKQGFLGSSNIDIITSGTLSGSASTENVLLFKTQSFGSGKEDLSVDVTRIVSATMAGLIPDHGFRISYSGSEETDTYTRFVKRFASTQHSNYSKRPRLEVKYNNSVQDHHEAFFFNISGSLFLNNFHRGSAANIISGSSASKLSGDNSLHVRLVSGTLASGTYFSKTITASQHKIGTNHITGVYSASFAISQWSTGALENEIKNAGSATFTEIWSSIDETIAFMTGSLIVRSVNRTSFNNQSKRIIINVTNMQYEYRISDVVRFRVFAENIDRPVKYSKVPLVTKSSIFTSMYYRVRDVQSNEVIVPFETAYGGTVCSTDSDGMYFDVYMDSLFPGRLYTIDFLVKDQGFDQVFTDSATKFRVV